MNKNDGVRAVEIPKTVGRSKPAMLTCDECRDLLADDSFGLLDAAEVEALRAHEAGCPTCAAVRSELTRERELIALAAKSPFPGVSFSPPVAPPIHVAPSLHLAADGRPRGSVHGLMTRWAVAAGVFLVVAGLGGGALRDLAATAVYRPGITRESAAMARADAEKTTLEADIAVARNDVLNKLKDASAKQDELFAKWAAAEETLIKAVADRPFRLEIDGPGTLVAGAPNEFHIRASDTVGNLKKVAIAATVVSARGEVIYERKLAAEFAHTLKLPASVWASDKLASGPAEIRISAVDETGAASARVQETVALSLPVLATHLAVDRPMVRPGETLYFRSLTLDRATLRPVTRDLTLKFHLEGPDGSTVNGTESVVSAFTADSTGQLIVGPDGQAIRGVACGAVAIPTGLSGGEYTLRCTESTTDPRAARGVVVPLASVRILVNNYTPDRFVKSLEFDGRTYGPGDVVQLLLKVKAGNRALTAADLKPTISGTVDGKLVPIVLDPASELVTDAEGKARFRFVLPKDELASASFAVSVTKQGVTETIVRPVPLRSRLLDVEFFPEGGDLIAGVPTNVYFRVVGANGKPADLKGAITDGAKTAATVATLTDANLPGVNQGFGRFTLTAEAGKDYYLIADGGVELKNSVSVGKRLGRKLPAAKSSGVALRLSNGVVKPGEPLPLQLTSAGEDRKLVVGVYLRGQALAVRELDVQADRPTDVALDLGGSERGGVLRVTVFEVPAEGNWKPVAERLAFRRGSEALGIAINPLTTPVPRTSQTLEIATTDEAGVAKPAVLYAAVVNQSVVAMADDKSARRLPAHFLIAGEVRKPDDLERADFFLDPSAKAAESLDLLLGTQGWRRFAEQAPDQFRRSVASADAEQLLASLGVRGHAPIPYRVETLKLYDEFRPKFETAASEVARLERNIEQQDYAEPFQQRVIDVSRSMSVSLGRMQSDAQEFWFFQDTIEQRETYAVPIVLVLALAAIGLVVVRYKVAKDWPERRIFIRAAVVLLATAVFVAFVVLMTASGDNSWRKFVPKPDRYDRFGSGGTTLLPPIYTGPPIGLPSNGDLQPMFATWDDRAAPLLGAKPKSPIIPARRIGVVPKPRHHLRGNPNAPGAKNSWAIAEVRFDIDDLISARRAKPLPEHLLESLKRLDANADESASGRSSIWNNTQRTPPSIVREYAFNHNLVAGTGGQPGGPGFAMPGSPAPSTVVETADTLLWKPLFVTDAAGKATLNFDLPTGSDTYDVLVAGHTLDGRLGATTTTIVVKQPLTINLKLPPEIGSTDVVLAPLTLTNSSEGVIQAELGFDVRNLTLDVRNLTLDQGGDAPEMVPGLDLGSLVEAKSALRKTLILKPTKNEGAAAVLAKLKTADGLNDFVRRNTVVVPAGYPVQGTTTGTLTGRTTLNLNLPAGLLPETLKATLAAYPNTDAELQAGLEGLLKEPVGCFEQASATNYPNVLILDNLRERGALKPETTLAAREFLERGYARLTGFECPVGTTGTRAGFEWFGAADRPHTALTAYALLQFTEMSRATKVDPELIARTRRFLLDRRNGAGGWRHGDEARSFGAAPIPTLDAYVTWAFTESDRVSGTKSDLAKEIDALKNADGGYRLALAAGAVLNAGGKDAAAKLVGKLKAAQKLDGRFPAGGPTITGSSGDQADLETTALAALVLLRVNETDAANAASNWILSQRKPQGGFGSTQGTILTLKLLAEQARLGKPNESKGTLVVVAGGRTITKPFNPNQTGPLIIDLPAVRLNAGDNTVDVSMADGRDIPVVVSWTARAETPKDKSGRLKLKTKLDAATYVEGSVAKLTATVTNTGESCGMTTTILGIPAGFKLPPDFKQMKSLTEPPPAGGEPPVSYYEVRGRELILYRRGMAAKETLTFIIDLIADVPGDYTGPASRTYLYYDDAAKDWQSPLKASITEAPPPAPVVPEEPKE